MKKTFVVRFRKQPIGQIILKEIKAETQREAINKFWKMKLKVWEVVDSYEAKQL